ncbi:Hairy/enhancer-of-split related with YRPW motif-like protein [Echinococcus granulosus]|nr:Hairy/enhancer-of-split related with YRPW motif-like protein [Echinococcus granulosus]
MRAHEKRCVSPDDDIEDDDIGSSGGYTGLDRKRRRGIIEKRRRDRINFNLSELRRLVPDAAQKQTSTKLEKAEILQMTVEFLHRIHRDGTILNTELRLLENRLLGFQECFAEVTRFLSALPVVSTMDEVFRKKLLSHLHACIYRRDYEARTRLASLSVMVSGSSTTADSQSAGSSNTTNQHSSSQMTWQQTPHVKEVNIESYVSNPAAYWHCNPSISHRSDEHNWPRTDSYHKQQIPKVQTGGVNESQSTTSPSVLGNYEETDSGNSTVNRFSPNDRDISTDVPPPHSDPTYTSGHVECERQDVVQAFQSGEYGSYSYVYHQAYSDPTLAVGTTTGQHVHSQEQLTTSGYILDNCQTAGNPHRDFPYYHDDF